VKQVSGEGLQSGIMFHRPRERSLLRDGPETRLSAGGVADHFVSQMLRQGDAGVFKRYSQAKLNMMRESLNRLDRKANEHGRISTTPEPS